MHTSINQVQIETYTLEIEGADFLFIRANHDGGKGGHNVETWNNILQRISDFLNDDDDED